MLNKLLFKNQDRKQLIIAMIGAFMGITFLITSIHYLIKVNEFGEGADILGPNTIMVQKKVSNSSTLKLTRTDFSPQELEKIKAESFLDSIMTSLKFNSSKAHPQKYLNIKLQLSHLLMTLIMEL